MPTMATLLTRVPYYWEFVSQAVLNDPWFAMLMAVLTMVTSKTAASIVGFVSSLFGMGLIDAPPGSVEAVKYALLVDLLSNILFLIGCIVLILIIASFLQGVITFCKSFMRFLRYLARTIEALTWRIGDEITNLIRACERMVLHIMFCISTIGYEAFCLLFRILVGFYPSSRDVVSNFVSGSTQIVAIHVQIVFLTLLSLGHDLTGKLDETLNLVPYLSRDVKEVRVTVERIFKITVFTNFLCLVIFLISMVMIMIALFNAAIVYSTAWVYYAVFDSSAVFLNTSYLCIGFFAAVLFAARSLAIHDNGLGFGAVVTIICFTFCSNRALITLIVPLMVVFATIILLIWTCRSLSTSIGKVNTRITRYRMVINGDIPPTADEPPIIIYLARNDCSLGGAAGSLAALLTADGWGHNLATMLKVVTPLMVYLAPLIRKVNDKLVDSVLSLLFEEEEIKTSYETDVLPDLINKTYGMLFRRQDCTDGSDVEQMEVILEESGDTIVEPEEEHETLFDSYFARLVDFVNRWVGYDYLIDFGASLRKFNNLVLRNRDVIKKATGTLLTLVVSVKIAKEVKAYLDKKEPAVVEPTEGNPKTDKEATKLLKVLCKNFNIDATILPGASQRDKYYAALMYIKCNSEQCKKKGKNKAKKRAREGTDRDYHLEVNKYRESQKERFLDWAMDQLDVEDRQQLWDEGRGNLDAMVDLLQERGFTHLPKDEFYRADEEGYESHNLKAYRPQIQVHKYHRQKFNDYTPSTPWGDRVDVTKENKKVDNGEIVKTMLKKREVSDLNPKRMYEVLMNGTWFKWLGSQILKKRKQPNWNHKVFRLGTAAATNRVDCIISQKDVNCTVQISLETGDRVETGRAINLGSSCLLTVSHAKHLGYAGIPPTHVLEFEGTEAVLIYNARWNITCKTVAKLEKSFANRALVGWLGASEVVQPALIEYKTAEYITTDRGFERGDSGGALLDCNGNVIGLVNYFLGNVSVYARLTDAIIEVASEIKSKQRPPSQFCPKAQAPSSGAKAQAPAKKETKKEEEEAIAPPPESDSRS